MDENTCTACRGCGGWHNGDPEDGEWETCFICLGTGCTEEA